MSEGTKNVVTTEEGALSVKKLTFWEAAMIIVGANIGAGILGLAYSTRKAGWPILLMWLIAARCMYHHLHAVCGGDHPPHQEAHAAARSGGALCWKAGRCSGLYLGVRQLDRMHDFLHLRQRQYSV